MRASLILRGQELGCAPVSLLVGSHVLHHLPLGPGPGLHIQEDSACVGTLSSWYWDHPSHSLSPTACTHPDGPHLLGFLSLVAGMGAVPRF